MIHESGRLGRLQGLASLLQILGDHLESLRVHGNTGLLGGFKFSLLWTVPDLRRLHMDAVKQTIDEADFEKGIACLK